MAMESAPLDTGGGARPGAPAGEITGNRNLRKSLNFLLVIGVSLALMGPSLSANIDVQPAAPLVGRAVPLTFAIATVGVLFVAWAFIRLSQDFNHAGSVFGLVGATLGSRAGVVAGWALFGTYTLFSVTSAIAGGIFASALVRQLGLWTAPAAWFPYAAALIFLVIVALLAIIPVRGGTRLLLFFEGATILLVLLVCLITAVRLIQGSGPGHLKFTMSVFEPTRQVGISTLFLGVVFGFLAFGGFEGACTMGEEATNPRRQIPRAVLGTVIVGGIFYTVTSALMVMGFGTSPRALSAFQASGSPLGFLGQNYVTAWVGDLITIGTMFSAFAGVLGLVIGASRLLFAITRAGSPRPIPLTAVSRRWGTPVGAVSAIVFVALVIVAIFGWGSATPAVTTFGYLGTMGTFLILVAYLMVVLGALKHFFLRRAATTRVLPRWEILIPIAAIVVAGYTFYRNLVPYPSGALFWVPIATLAWLCLALSAMVLTPSLARRIGLRLMEDPGLTRVD
jgi:amino acid transporter